MNFVTTPDYFLETKSLLITICFPSSVGSFVAVFTLRVHPCSSMKKQAYDAVVNLFNKRSLEDPELCKF